MFECGKGDVCTAGRIEAAYDAGARILNLSWNWTKPDNVTPEYSTVIRSRLALMYNKGCITVAAMGNFGTSVPYYPASISRGVIAVGGTTDQDIPVTDSNTGPHIWLAAPGQHIITTNSTGTYSFVDGTSFAAAYVSGIASLLKSVDGNLDHDDAANLLRWSALDLMSSGFDTQTGWGRASAARALRLLQLPNDYRPVMTFTGGQPYGNWQDVGYMQFYNVLGLPETATYQTFRREIRKRVLFSPPFAVTPKVWGRHDTRGFSADSPNWGMNWCDADSVTTAGCVLRTYIYMAFKPSENRYITVPEQVPYDAFTNTYGVEYSVRALAISPTLDPTRSYYVPEAVVSGVVKDGLSTPKSYQFFRGCPNNDGASYPASARAKVVVKDAAGNGISNVPATDIFVLFNGGSPVQGFVGEGSDSVVANSQYGTPTSVCPNLRGLIADAPTNANGIAYITFGGAGGTRDSGRMWGHFDSEMPVYVLGTKVSGRLSDASAPGSYALQIKSVDRSGGLSLFPNDHGEIVDSADSNKLTSEMAPLYGWWSDLDSSGAVNSTDFSILNAHFAHTCSNPCNPSCP